VTLEELLAELAAGRLRPAYLLAGSEPLLREDALRALVEAILEPEARDFNLDRLDGASTSAATLEDALRTLPVLAPRRLVVLREPEARKRGAAGLGDALARLVPALPDPPQTILVVTAGHVDARAKWVRGFGDPALRVSCDPPRPGKAVVAFVRAEAKRQGLKLEPRTAETLAERVGPQLLLLRSELGKAALYAGPGRSLTPDHVSDSVSRSAEDPIWDLTDALGTGRLPDALAILQRMEAGGAPPPVLLGALAAHFRKLARVSAGAKVAGHPFAVKKLEKQAKRYTTRRLRTCLRAIHETDEALKGKGELAPALALERLVLSL
jgi:DNA polymerase-3 subunit delta